MQFVANQAIYLYCNLYEICVDYPKDGYCEHFHHLHNLDFTDNPSPQMIFLTDHFIFYHIAATLRPAEATTVISWISIIDTHE